MQVADARSATPILAASRPSRRQVVALVGGVVAVLGTVGTTLSYMAILQKYIQNDYFWTDFNISGTQTYVSDVLNAQLWTPAGLGHSTPLALFSSDAAMTKDYSGQHTAITIQPSRNRQIAADEINNVAFAIAALRAQTMAKSARSLTCHCWIDFGRRWEVAFTVKRQARCVSRYADNGAVYAEAMLRNVEWATWSALWGSRFDVAYGTAVRAAAGGSAWLNQTKAAVSVTTVEAELDFWTRFNVTRYTISWHNHQVMGFDGSVTIRNVFETFSIPLHQVMSQKGLWTSTMASIGVWNGYSYAVSVNASLVRSASNSFIYLPESKSPEMWNGGYPDTVWSVLLHDVIGPIGGIEIFYIQPPRSFVHLYDLLHKALVRDLQTNQVTLPLQTTPFDMVPPSWRRDGLLYAGGNPMCYTGKLRPYVQQSIGFDDACTDPYPPLTAKSSAIHMVMATWLVQTSHGAISHAHICAMTGNATRSMCLSRLVDAQRFLDAWLPLSSLPVELLSVLTPAAIQATKSLRVQLMQYAAHNNTHLVLHQLLLDDADPSWSFYGWLHLLDWVQGNREVLALEGDESTVVLVSKAYDPQPFVVDPLSTPNRFAYTMWVFAWYTNIVTFVVTGVAVGCAVAWRSALSWRNLVSMNRVASIVWIGRPLVMVRGLLALALLSMAKMELDTVHGLTSLLSKRRSVWEVLILSGESLWLTYAVNDIMSLATGRHTFHCGVASSALVWVITVVLELLSPVVPTAVLDRKCVSSNMEIHLSCVFGDIEIGSFDRFVVLCVIQAVALLVSWWASARLHTKPHAAKAPVIIPAVACAHFDRNASTDLFFDVPSSILSGCLPFQVENVSYVFSILLWVVLPVTERAESSIFHAPVLHLCPQKSTLDVALAPSLRPWPMDAVMKYRQPIAAVMGLGYLVASAISSASFFWIAESKLSNNFMWEGLNSTGLQAFLLDWYNFEVIFRPKAAYLDETKVQIQAFYNNSLATLSSSSFSANTAQFEALSLEAVIAGLRSSHACDLPWVATQHCWVDFGRRWEIANSELRQQRCHQAMRSNGAVYLEALLRNTDMSAFQACWGDAVEVGVFTDLRQSLEGKQWIEAVGAPPEGGTIDEVAYWTMHNITDFVMQWQNYKSIGLVETLRVQSAVGLSYPFTMKSTNGSYRFHLETTRKMYWGWGSDLWAASHNTTGLGTSFLRTSPNFVFQNRSMESLMALNNTLAQPLDAGFALVRASLGPFGSTDMFHVPCPQDLLQLARDFVALDQLALLDKADAQLAVKAKGDVMHPTPTAWQRYSLARGGDLLCPVSVGSLAMSAGMLTLFSMYNPCGTYIWEVFPTTRSHLVFATAAWGAQAKCTTATCASVRGVCGDIAAAASTCVENVMAVVQWSNKYMTNASRATIYQSAQQLKPKLLSINIELIQYAQRNASAPLELLRATLFDPNDPSFELMAWQTMFGWALGFREVVSFQGDTGTMTVMSSYTIYTTKQPNALEIPTYVAFYCKLCLQYTTAVIFSVTLLTILVTIASKGHVEGLNMLEVNRVAGIVWVGRPLLCLRSLVAILLLATSSATLESTGTFTSLATATGVGWASTLLSGLETSWLVIVITDVGMAITRDHTSKYTMYSSVIVTVLATVLSVVYPVKPKFLLDRTCTSPQVNFQIECTAGLIQIGSVTRVLELVTLTSAVVVVSFLWERWRHPQFQLPQHNPSMLLPAGALYLYSKEPWIYKGTLYLDKASSFMCGLIAVSYKRSIYLLDIKTWRVHTIEIDDGFNPRQLSKDAYRQLSIASAVPLVD